MRLITFQEGSQIGLGAWVNDDQTIVKLALASELLGARQHSFASMQDLIEAGPRALDHARSVLASAPEEAHVDSSNCRILSPLPRPVQLRDFLSFPGHVLGCRKTIAELMIKGAPNPVETRAQLKAAGFFDVPQDFFEFPAYYICNRFGISGPEDLIEWPAFSGCIDYELEWAAIIGKEGAQVRKAAAKDFIFGYTVFNDWSARDEQTKAMSSSSNAGPAPGKDFANTLGPCIVTADEVPDPYGLSMRAYLNGELVSQGNTGGMHYSFEDAIEYLTRSHSIFPGEVLGSGTVGGGCSFETGHGIFHGDVIELEVERIGRLRNRVNAPHVRPENFTGFGSVLGAALKLAAKR